MANLFHYWPLLIFIWFGVVVWVLIFVAPPGEPEISSTEDVLAREAGVDPMNVL